MSEQPTQITAHIEWKATGHPIDGWFHNMTFRRYRVVVTMIVTGSRLPSRTEVRYAWTESGAKDLAHNLAEQMREDHRRSHITVFIP